MLGAAAALRSSYPMGAMSTSLLRLLTASALLTLASCASMMAGSDSSIAITSTPPGATITTCTGLEAKAPCVLTLPNGADVTITAQHLDHPGDVRKVLSVPDLSRWYAGNLIMIGGAAGMVSDVANPSAYVHKRDVHFDFSFSEAELAELEAAKQERLHQRRASSGGTLR